MNCQRSIEYPWVPGNIRGPKSLSSWWLGYKFQILAVIMIRMGKYLSKLVGCTGQTGVEQEL